jgi:hypothetical protein
MPLDRNLLEAGVFEREFTGKSPLIRQLRIVLESGALGV